MDENETNAARYRVDAGRSRFIVKAFVTGMLSAFGHSPTIAIRDFTGEAHFDPDSLKDASLNLRIKADSLEVTDDVSDKDRREMERQMRDDVLETNRYPEIVFESTDVSADKITGGQCRARVTGNLSLRGITRNCVINAQVTVTGDGLRAHGEFPLRQSDYNIKPVSAAGGTIKLKDELKFSFDIVAHQERG
jgi:polyisoprenoid-binding protein YceI